MPDYVNKARQAQQEHVDKARHDVQIEMQLYMQTGIDLEWYCEHNYYQGFECPDCDAESYLPLVQEFWVKDDATDF